MALKKVKSTVEALLRHMLLPNTFSADVIIIFMLNLIQNWFLVVVLIVYIMTQGIAQQTGRQMGMTAAPPAPALNLVSDSKLYTGNCSFGSH